MKTCSQIGRLVRDDSNCRVLLPTGGFELSVNKSSLPDRCDDYSVIRGDGPQNILAWKEYDQEIKGFAQYICDSATHCYQYIEQLVSFLSECSGEHRIIVWFAMIRPIFGGCFAFAKCRGEYYIATKLRGQKMLNDLNVSMGYIVPGSLFYSMNLSVFENPSDHVFLLPTSNMRDNAVLVMLAINL